MLQKSGKAFLIILAQSQKNCYFFTKHTLNGQVDWKWRQLQNMLQISAWGNQLQPIEIVPLDCWFNQEASLNK